MIVRQKITKNDESKDVLDCNGATAIAMRPPACINPQVVHTHMHGRGIGCCDLPVKLELPVVPEFSIVDQLVHVTSDVHVQLLLVAAILPVFL
jgi:hypothetical protein